MKKSIPLIIWIIITAVGCGSPKPDVYLYRNQKFFSIFEDKQEVFLTADRFFRKSGYTVRHINFSKFTDLSKESDIVKNRTKALPEGAIFWTDNLQMTVFINNLKSSQSTNYKLISYHYDTFQKDNLPSQTLINFYPNIAVIYRAIIREIKHLSNTEDFNDVMYIYSSSYPLPAKIADLLKKDYPTVKISNCTSKGAVKNAINNSAEQYKAFIVFCFDYNVALAEFDAKTLGNKKITEIMTNYGEEYQYIGRSILLDEPILADHALHSKELHRYLSGQPVIVEQKDKNIKETKPTVKSNIINVPLNYNNIVRVVTQTMHRERIGVKLEELIKENNKKKEEAEKKKKKQEEEKMQKKE